MEIKLAEALLRRKELQEKVNLLRHIKDKDCFETKIRRKQISDTIDDIVAEVPVMDASQFTAEYDWHAKQLRLIDSVIQQANWTTGIKVDSTVMTDFHNK